MSSERDRLAREYADGFEPPAFGPINFRALEESAFKAGFDSALKRAEGLVEALERVSAYFDEMDDPCGDCGYARRLDERQTIARAALKAWRDGE